MYYISSIALFYTLRIKTLSLVKENVYIRDVNN